ncbi:MAG TPA: hypothetical protein VIV66_05350 [Pyrinomonadaceae bacterium]
MKRAFALFNPYLIAVIFVLSLSARGFGQVQTPAGAGPPPNINPKAEERSRQLAEGRLRSAEMDATLESENTKRIEAAIVNMKKDFTRIQVIRNEIARNLVARKPLDYKLIAEETAEIHKRANRLNLYMLAHSSGNEDEKISSDPKSGEMTGALVRLCKLIDSFTENPALKNVATLDVHNVDKVKEEKARADKDLLEIIKLSEDLQKKSETLRGSN